jgi:hypothetical protein
MPIYTLTDEQAELLRAASEGEVYWAMCGPVSRLADDLLVAGLLSVREEPQSGGTRGPNDSRPCTWTDKFLRTTPAGMAMLKNRVCK